MSVTPALTPDEWRVLFFEDDDSWGNGASLDGELLSIEYEYGFKPRARHSLAALCLHGQPFGFHRGDVRLARENGLHSLADRIASLLPPEEE